MGCCASNSDNELDNQAMNEEMDDLVNQAMSEMQAKMQVLISDFEFGKWDTWTFDQKDGILRFRNVDGRGLDMDAQIVGSFSQVSDTWMWAWANDSIGDHLKLSATRVKQYGEIRQLFPLTMAQWDAEEMDAWAMAALAAKLTDAVGSYRCPNSQGAAFVIFNQPRRVPANF